MSQEDIIAALGARKLTRKEIQELTGLAQQAVSYSLKQLLKYEEILKEYSEGMVPIYHVKDYERKKKSGRAFRPSRK